jgi:hypothetical protein
MGIRRCALLDALLAGLDDHELRVGDASHLEDPLDAPLDPAKDEDAALPL